MKKYHKILTVLEHDPDTNHKTVIPGKFACPEFEYLKMNPWSYTEKVNGTNTRILYDGKGSIEILGKTDDALLHPKMIEKIHDLLFPATDPHPIIATFGGPACLYGEGYGAKIHKGSGNYRDHPDFVLFDVNIDGWWLRRNDVEDIAEKLHLDVVPIIGEGTLIDMINKTQAGFKSQWGNFIAEGIVARPKTELFMRNGERVITKIKYRDFKR